MLKVQVAVLEQKKINPKNMEENTKIDLWESTIFELKALAYDMLARIEFGQKNLQIINQEIAKRSIAQPKQEPDGEQKV